MVETFKIVTGRTDVDPSIWFTKVATAENGRCTRLAADPLNLRVPAARLEVRKHFFSVRVCEKWNTLPSEVKNAKNVSHFKQAYRRFMENRA